FVLFVCIPFSFRVSFFILFFFNDPAPTEIYTLSLHDALPILVSEFAVGTFAAPQNFPIRNRVISGLALGVLVVEAGEYSGTRITARCALEQSRELFAVPGNVTSRNSWGPNTLIKQGAKLTATWEDVWEELPAGIRQELESERPP